jgi:hypothetical protein
MSDIMSVVVPTTAAYRRCPLSLCRKQKGTSTPWALQDALGGYHLPGKYPEGIKAVLKISKHPVIYT